MSGPLALVTGATGGLGMALCEALLAEGYRVYAAGRREAPAKRLAAMGARAFLADLETADLDVLCKDVDVVFHAAALSSPWGPPESFTLANVTATERLLDAAEDAGVARFVFVSSPSVYAVMADHLMITEEDLPAAAPLNAYARTKLEAERMVREADDEDGMRTVIVRPRALIGPDDAVLLPRVIRLVHKGRFPIFREGRALIELTDVRDAARALVLAGKVEAAAGEIFNISGGSPVSVRALATALSEALGRPIVLTPVSMGVALPAAQAAEALCGILPGRPEPVLTPYTLATLAYSQTFDMTKAKEILGFEPAFNAMETARMLAPRFAS